MTRKQKTWAEVARVAKRLGVKHYTRLRSFEELGRTLFGVAELEGKKKRRISTGMTGELRELVEKTCAALSKRAGRKVSMAEVVRRSLGTVLNRETIK